LCGSRFRRSGELSNWLASRPHIKSQLKQMASFILLGRPKFIAVVFRRLGTSVTAAPLPI
jgi:hypothetical protein